MRISDWSSDVCSSDLMALTDPRLSEMAQSLSKALGGRSVYFIDASADEAHWLLWAGTDTDPGRYYRYTPGLKQLRPLLEDRPALADVALSPVRPVRSPAPDGPHHPADRKRGVV